MTKPQKSCPLQAIGLGNLFATVIVGMLLAPPAKAQAITEAASSSSLSSSVAASAKPMQMPNSLPSVSSAPSGTSPHLLAPTLSLAAQVETNRRVLEQKAGRNAARLLIRSDPSQAQVWIDGKPVGTSPLLLIVPPGNYNIELRGSRQENGRQEVALLPKELQEVTVKLVLRYPTHVTSGRNGFQFSK